MKKFIIWMLIFLLSLSLCACGGKETPETTAAPTEPETTVERIIGTWISLEDQRVVINGNTTAGTRVVIKEDKTGEIRQGDQSVPVTWEYDEATRTLILYNALDKTKVEVLTYLEVIDALYNDWNGMMARVDEKTG
ncbi:MAG: hypothetical protein IJO31_07355 [Oscillospiraceae bacterium]|nr:hypothetical protein [Oscillospiraceae bacterium]